MNILKQIEANMVKQSHITGIMAELKEVIESGSAEHFIAWHNSKVTLSNRISPDWYNQYRKECGE